MDITYTILMYADDVKLLLKASIPNIRACMTLLTILGMPQGLNANGQGPRQPTFLPKPSHLISSNWVGLGRKVSPLQKCSVFSLATASLRNS